MMNKKQSNTHQLFLVALAGLVQHSIKEAEIQCSIRFGLWRSRIVGYERTMRYQTVQFLVLHVIKNVKLQCNTI